MSFSKTKLLTQKQYIQPNIHFETNKWLEKLDDGKHIQLLLKDKTYRQKIDSNKSFDTHKSCFSLPLESRIILPPQTEYNYEWEREIAGIISHANSLKHVFKDNEELLKNNVNILLKYISQHNVAMLTACSLREQDSNSIIVTAFNLFTLLGFIVKDNLNKLIKSGNAQTIFHITRKLFNSVFSLKSCEISNDEKEMNSFNEIENTFQFLNEYIYQVINDNNLIKKFVLHYKLHQWKFLSSLVFQTRFNDKDFSFCSVSQYLKNRMNNELQFCPTLFVYLMGHNHQHSFYSECICNHIETLIQATKLHIILTSDIQRFTQDTSKNLKFNLIEILKINHNISEKNAFSIVLCILSEIKSICSNETKLLKELFYKENIDSFQIMELERLIAYCHNSISGNVIQGSETNRNRIYEITPLFFRHQ